MCKTLIPNVSIAKSRTNSFRSTLLSIHHYQWPLQQFFIHYRKLQESSYTSISTMLNSKRCIQAQTTIPYSFSNLKHILVQNSTPQSTTHTSTIHSIQHFTHAFNLTQTMYCLFTYAKRRERDAKVSKIHKKFC